MKEIILKGGHTTQVSDEDFERFNSMSWYRRKARCGGNSYASGEINGKSVQLHRLILNAPKGMFVDHIDRNGLNNQRENLRLCTQSQNQANRVSKPGSSSKFLGVSWSKRDQVWSAGICINSKRMGLGNFENEIDAAKAYNEKAIELHGAFANINKIEPNDK